MITVPLLYLCWVLYLAIMALDTARRKDKLPVVAYRLALPLLCLGYLVDFLSNMVITVLFLDFPREVLVTSRLQRYADGPDGWRRRLGLWFARNLLNPFDPKGYHVKE